MTPDVLTALYEAQICPACGFKLWFKPWSGQSASDEICPSCGIQFGYTDFTTPGDLAGRIARYGHWRRKWIAAGMKWEGMEAKPDDWNPQKQLERVQDVA
jgi:hypothetical protein